MLALRALIALLLDQHAVRERVQCLVEILELFVLTALIATSDSTVQVISAHKLLQKGNRAHLYHFHSILLSNVGLEHFVLRMLKETQFVYLHFLSKMAISYLLV